LEGEIDNTVRKVLHVGPKIFVTSAHDHVGIYRVSLRKITITVTFLTWWHEAIGICIKVLDFI
jgi:hypothetical protein